MPCDDYDPYDDWDDEPPPPPPLKEWKKRDLRDEVVRLRERTADLQESLSDQVSRADRLRIYVQANRRHSEMIEKLTELFGEQGWRMVDMTMTVENPVGPVSASINSLYVSHVQVEPRGLLTIDLRPCPPTPEEVS